MSRLTHNGVEVLAKLGQAAKQTRYAAAVALNRTLFAVKEAEAAEMDRVFDRPTPYVRKSVRVLKLDLRDERSEGRVMIDSDYYSERGVPAEKILRTQILGGDRHQKRFEVALRRAHIMYADEVAVPSPHAPRDRYGNVPGSYITKLLSYLRAFSEQGYKANITDRRRAALKAGTRRSRGVEFFVSGGPGTWYGAGAWRQGRSQNLHRGIWMKTHTGFGAAIKPIFFFVDAANYERRFKFYDVATRTIERTLAPEFDRALDQAWRSVR